MPFFPEVTDLNIHKIDGKISVSFEFYAPSTVTTGQDDDSEHAIQKKIQLALSKHQCTVFRANVGKIRLPDGRFFSTGLPKGFSDLFGFRWTDGKVFFIEVKRADGKARAEQTTFHKMLQSHNIIHGIARTVNDALMIIDGGLVGYGY
ncbi:VRR-NUC domain-containing protein [Lactobacillus xujianguonis]|uniref:VRR-NUC domain-containing protein n=1 Tax=Lactobacillus xujianguonis TaxID=2495899 RepID=A0A437SY63_9LACO|nr:VRR-NUC domain-containing protein [Lactobacillus xujianguonis]